MPYPPSSADVPPDSVLPIPSKLPCSVCGYNIEELSGYIQCPGCGAQTHQLSLRRALCDADRGWLRRLRTGVALILVGFVLFASSFLIPFVAPRTLPYLPAFATLIGVIGIFLLTSADTQEYFVSRRNVFLWIIRMCAVLDLAALGLNDFLPYSLMLVAWVSGFVGKCGYLMWLATLIPRRALVWQTAVVVGGLGLSAAVGILVVLGGAASGLMGGGGSRSADASTYVVGVFVLIFSLWYVGLLLQYIRAFSDFACTSHSDAAIRSSEQVLPHRNGRKSTDIVESEVLTCARCGYILRGMTVDGQCPECGLSINLSLKGNLLALANPAWTRKLELGAGLLLLAVSVMVVVQIAHEFFLGWRSIPLGLDQIAFATSLLLTCLGSLLITIREPGFRSREGSDTARQILRIGAVLQLLFFFYFWYLIPGPSWFVSVATIATIVHWVTLLSCYYLLLSIARRIPNPLLKTCTRALLSAYLIIYSIALILGFKNDNPPSFVLAGFHRGTRTGTIGLDVLEMVLVTLVHWTSILLAVVEVVVLRMYMKAFTRKTVPI
jgi:predicted RNA-binding Zn-ribbon protein involved in translation (DUF1610 family)